MFNIVVIVTKAPLKKINKYKIDNRNQPDKVPHQKRKNIDSIIHGNDKNKVKNNSQKDDGDVEMMEKGGGGGRMNNQEKKKKGILITTNDDNTLVGTIKSGELKDKSHDENSVTSKSIKPSSSSNSSSDSTSNEKSMKNKKKNNVNFVNDNIETNMMMISKNSNNANMTIPEDYTGWGIAKEQEKNEKQHLKKEKINLYNRGESNDKNSDSSCNRNLVVSTLEVRESYFSDSQYEDDAGFRRAEDSGQVDSHLTVLSDLNMNDIETPPPQQQQQYTSSYMERNNSEKRKSSTSEKSGKMKTWFS